MSFYAFQLNRDVDRYKNLYSRLINPTVYHSPEYLLAEEKGEEAPAQIFVCEKDGEIALMPLIKRNIGSIAGLEDFKGYFDLKTPHEYSGAVASTDYIELYEDFWSETERYCNEHNIIFQFVRFNPYKRDYIPAGNSGAEVEKSDTQVYMDISRGLEEAVKDFNPVARRNLRRAETSNLGASVVQKTDENINLFIKLYERAMTRLRAKKFFYFNNSYFQSIISMQNSLLMFIKQESNLAAAAILLEDKTRLYYHLGCMDREYNLARPMEFMYYKFCELGIEKGKTQIHLGGGSETLNRFKSKFSSKRVDYYIGYKVYNPKIYAELTDIVLKKYGATNVNFKPAYRFTPPPEG